MRKIKKTIIKNIDFEDVIEQVRECNGVCEVRLDFPFNCPKKNPIAKFDELLLLRVYLLAINYPETKFDVIIENCQRPGSDEEFFSIQHLTRIQKKNSKKVTIMYHYYKKDADNIVLQKWGVHYNFQNENPYGQWGPLMPINDETLQILMNPYKRRKKQPEVVVEMNKYHQDIKKRKINKIENTKIGEQITVKLNQLRDELFENKKMKEHLTEMSFLGQIIFYYFDHAYRKNAISELVRLLNVQKEKVKYCEDGFFLESKQWKLDSDMNAAMADTLKEGYDNQTLFRFTKNNQDDFEEPHSFVLATMAEASTIAEGILQLLENIVVHGAPGNEGKGMLSIHLRNKETDLKLLSDTYGAYFTEGREERFFFEIVISDLSETSIPENFKTISNNKLLSLEDFFVQKKAFWKKFYEKTENAISHYGLGIFSSMVAAKDGIFICKSGNETYLSTKKTKKTKNLFEETQKTGTTYYILLPMASKESSAPRSNESIYGYNFSEFTGKEYHDFYPFSIDKLPDLKHSAINKAKKVFIHELKNDMKEEYSNALLANQLSGKDGVVMVIDVDTGVLLERFIKASLLFLYEIVKNPSESDNKARIAIINLSDFQFLEAVRIVALYYNKQGQNPHFENASLFLKGKTIGLELEFFGTELSAVQNSMIHAAMISGISPKFIKAIQQLLTRNEVN